jgi:tRNA-dihydrouridine synthase B
LLHEIQLPGLTIPGNLFLAPMAGYSDAAFRSVCTDWGASLCYTEMISVEGVVRNNPRTLDLLARSDSERLLAVQIFGAHPAAAARAVRKLQRYNPSLYDLNCGCSVPKILKSGAGAALLREPGKITALVRAMCGETDVPVSVKLRSGWDQNSLNYLETADCAEQGGAVLVCLHPRTRSEGFSGQAHLSHLRALKQHSRLTVVGSGDLFTAEDARTMLLETGCDGLMFARGALGNPFIFTQTINLLSGSPSTSLPTVQQKLKTALKQLELAVAFKGEERACRDMRKQFCHYSKGIPGGAALRSQAVRARRVEDYRRLVAEFLGQQGMM